MPHNCIPCTSTLQISVLGLEKQVFWVILSTSLSTCVRERYQCWLFSPCSFVAHLTPTLLVTFPELCHHPASGHLHHLHSYTQEGAMSLCPGQGHLLPGEGVICLLATSFFLLGLLTFPHVQLISRLQLCPRLPVLCHLRMSQRVFLPSLRARVAGGLSWVPHSHLCSGAPAHTGDQQLLGESSCAFPASPASHKHPSNLQGISLLPQPL